MSETDTLQKSERAGSYERQIDGSSAFIPKPLPPEPSLDMHKLQPLLSEANIALGRLDGAAYALPNADLFVLMYVRKEAVLSSRIEGVQSSLHDLLRAEANILKTKVSRDTNEIINHVRAMERGVWLLAELPVGVRLLRETHQVLMQGTHDNYLRPGELRHIQNWIGAPGSMIQDATFVPPPPHLVDDQFGDLATFINEDDSLPLLIKIGLAHAQFETIHPFLDGNGRVGRMLIGLLLAQNKVLPKPMLYLSHYFNRHRRDYYAHLQAVHDEGAFEQWLVFFLRAVIEVSTDATATARRVLQLREMHREWITGNLGRRAGNGQAVLDKLYRHPIVKVQQVQQWTGTSYATANTLVAQLVEGGILHEVVRRARNRIFVYQDYVDLFDEEGKSD